MAPPFGIFLRLLLILQANKNSDDTAFGILLWVQIRDFDLVFDFWFFSCFGFLIHSVILSIVVVLGVPVQTCTVRNPARGYAEFLTADDADLADERLC